MCILFDSPKTGKIMTPGVKKNGQKIFEKPPPTLDGAEIRLTETHQNPVNQAARVPLITPSSPSSRLTNL